MRFFQRRKPNVKSLAKAGEIDGLVNASRYSEMLATDQGVPVDAGAAVREEAIVALADAAEGEDRDAIVRRLREALTDPVERVRRAAVMTLYRLEEAGPLAEAVARLPSGEDQARATAIRALIALRVPGSAAELAAALLYRDDELALGDAGKIVATLIEEEGTPDAARDVAELAVTGLRDTRSVVAFRAEELLDQLGTKGVDLLLDELTKRNGSPRAAAILGKIRDARALEALVAALEHPDSRMRSESCAALGELRDPAAAEALLAATRDPEYEVRASAGEALDSIGTAAIVVSVAALLRPVLEAAQVPPAYPSLPAGNGHPPLEGSGSLEWELVLDEGATVAPSKHREGDQRGANQAEGTKDVADEQSVANGHGLLAPRAQGA
jgi:HEAT repeat protein